jgi:3D (Asp-Asp-Asp) domain-containing protein
MDGKPIMKKKLLLLIFLTIFHSASAYADIFKITAYDSCKKCCGKVDGITASGKIARYGYIACNWLPFGTKVYIKGLGEFKVMDRGAKSLFGSKKNKIKHVDIWLANHKMAKNFGVKYLDVEIVK